MVDSCGNFSRLPTGWLRKKQRLRWVSPPEGTDMAASLSLRCLDVIIQELGVSCLKIGAFLLYTDICDRWFTASLPEEFHLENLLSLA